MIYRTTVSAVIKHNATNKYLLVKQPNNVGVYPGQWAIPGGGIEPNEMMYDAIKRECREEVGLEIDHITPLRFDEAIRQKLTLDGPSKEVYMIMLVFTSESAENNVALNYEAAEYKWVNLEEILSYDLNDPTRKTFELIIKGKA